MFQVSRWKVIMVALATVLSIVFALPNLLPKSTLESLPGWVPAKTLNLGLDLRGGAYLLLEADTGSLRKEHLTNLAEDIRNTLQNEDIEFNGPTREEDRVVVDIKDPARAEAAYTAISGLARPAGGVVGGVNEYTVARNDSQIVVTFQPDALATLTSDAVAQSVEVIRRRIDPEGNKEISISRQGASRIVVQAPGDSDPERLKNLIGQTAKLTFQMVDQTANPEEAAAGFVPPGDELVPYDARRAQGFEVVNRRAIITGEMLTRAAVTTDQNNLPAVSLRFNSQGGKRFGDVTSQNIGKRFAIILDGKVISAPVIQGAILGGNGQITNIGTIAEAKDLSDLLNGGSLPIKLEVLETRAVTAELGADAVKAGMIATIVAFVIVLIFMVFIYGGIFGGSSIVALLVNGAMIIAIMSVTQATLTLPGIGGLILTLGMAVDANVLIYERMRDEMRAGRNAIVAMETGFGKAMVTIIDANLTTLIAAAIMFIFGVGPVRGFAWTLAIGVVTSVLTAVFMTQVLLAFWFRAARPKLLPIS